MPSPARSIASLTLSFGLVAIPVKLYSATLPTERISFNFLREKDGSRIKQQYVAVADGKPVAPNPTPSSPLPCKRPANAPSAAGSATVKSTS